MKIKSVRLKDFRRFTDLTLEELSPAIHLVILAGPNGCGKSSLFDAFNTWHRNKWRGHGGWDPTYHVKQAEKLDVQWPSAIVPEFYDPQPDTDEKGQKAFYVRSAYRNDPEFEVDRLERLDPVLRENRLARLIDNDATVGLNYRRLASAALADVFELEAPTTTIGEFRERAIGDIRDAVTTLFPELSLNSLGNPLTRGTFRFSKGISNGFPYKNLSGGEKSAFDLLLDIVIKRREYDDTIFCIDEPEAHMSTRLQGRLLEELYRLVPERSQLWLATHSIGMMRAARDLYERHPGTVAFLDFENLDFDQPQILRPTPPTRAFWRRVLSVALDDLAALVAPSRVVICEGSPLGTGGKREAVDAKCYDRIFEAEFADTRFLSAGDANAVETDRLALMEAIRSLVGGTRVIRLVDRDARSAEEIQILRTSGIAVLSKRHLEAYLFDDEILDALSQHVGKPELGEELLLAKTRAISESVARHNPPDDIKSASGEIYTAAKRILKLTNPGNSVAAFMTDTLAPLMCNDMQVYKQLRADIFHIELPEATAPTEG